MPDTQPRVVIVGGGISGLAAAHRLMELSRNRRSPPRITVLEAGSRPGGLVRTAREEGFVFEEGPDSFLLEKPWAKALCERLDLQESLIPTQKENRRSFLLHNGRLCPIPEGFHLFAPARFWPVARNPLLSWRGKVRMALEVLLPKKKGDEDEGFSSFVVRRFGKEVLLRLAEPLVAGIYAGDARRLSMKAIMPRLLQMERNHGSVILGIRREAKPKGRSELGGGARYFLFASLRQGIEQLIAALTRTLPAESLCLGNSAVAVDRSPGSGIWQVHRKNGPPLQCHALCLAVPAWEVSRLLESWAPSLAKKLASIPYASSAVINLGYRRSDVAHPLDGFGFVVPATERRSLIACTFSSVKFQGRAPSGSVLIRAFAGGALRPALMDLTDDALETMVRGDLKEILGIRAKPNKVLITRHLRSMPQYEIGHLSRVESIEAELLTMPGLALAGNAYRGVGLPDCIHSGEVAAESIVSWLDKQQAQAAPGRSLT